MLVEREPVGHAGNIVGDRFRGQRGARRARARLPVRRETVGLLEQDRTSLFTQEIGNIPPGAEVSAEIVIDQRLRWLESGAWEWRFPTVVAPRYVGSAGRVADRERVTVDVADGPLDVSASVALAIRDPLCGYRCIPLAPTLALLDAHSCGDHMEFDPELAVRLVWRGLEVVNVPTRVRYFAGGVSHFDLWMDNVRISGSHARLFFGMLARGFAEASRREPVAR